MSIMPTAEDADAASNGQRKVYLIAALQMVDMTIDSVSDRVKQPGVCCAASMSG